MRFIQYFVGGMLIAFLSTLGLFYLLLGHPSVSSEGIYQTYKLKRQLMQTTESPRLVFVGGSGTLLGIGTDIIAEYLDINTVNFGIYAGLDLNYQLFLLEELLQPGDNVVFAFEYSAYKSTVKMSANTRNYVTQRDKDFFLSLPIRQQLQQALSLGPGGMVKVLVEALLPQVKITGRYPIDKINSHGDQTVNRLDQSPLNENEAEAIIAPLEFKEINQYAPLAFEQINQFIHRHRQKTEATFFVTFPNLWDHPQQSREAIEFFETQFVAAFSEAKVPILGEAEDFLYDFSYIYDTLYHLNKKGVEHRSKQLAILLAPYLGKSVDATYQFPGVNND